MDVRVVDHPLALARLTTMRDARTDNAAFRAALRDLTLLLVVEVGACTLRTRDTKIHNNGHSECTSRDGDTSDHRRMCAQRPEYWTDGDRRPQSPHPNGWYATKTVTPEPPPTLY